MEHFEPLVLHGGPKTKTTPYGTASAPAVTQQIQFLA
jgi:hypothetical protein